MKCPYRSSCRGNGTLDQHAKCAKAIGVERFFHRDIATLDDGRKVSVFINLDRNLIVLDVINKDESGGIELVRRYV